MRKTLWLLVLLLGMMTALPDRVVVEAAAPLTGAAQRQAAVKRALTWLRNQQTPDGRIGGLGAACEAAWVAALAGEDPDGTLWTPAGGSLLDACAADAPTYLARRDAGRLAKTLRAVSAAGANPREFAGMDLIAELEAKYLPAVGLYDANFLYRQNLAALALHVAGRPLPAGLLPALLAQQQPDGGWSWAVEPDPAAGFSTESDLDTTARTLQVLRALQVDLNHPAYLRGRNWLAARQRADGGWGLVDGPTNANSTALAIEGLLAAGWDPESPAFTREGANPVQVLLALQEASGAFIYQRGAEESRLLAVFDAVPALLASYPSDVTAAEKCFLPMLVFIR